MNITLIPHPLSGTISDTIASKSAAHRALICAALADAPTTIECNSDSRDITATAGALRALGAKIDAHNGIFRVEAISSIPGGRVTVNCDESGSTLRFLLPVIGALGIRAAVTGSGRLASRPLSPLYEELTAHGMTLSPQGAFPLECGGRLRGRDYTVDGGVSSQFFTGLMFALAATGGGKINVTGRLESKAYVDMTSSALAKFGVATSFDNGIISVEESKLRSPERIKIEGDWSNAAFWLVAGALSKKGVTVAPLDKASVQGDREIAQLLEKIGADVKIEGSSVTVRRKSLRGIEIEASDIPDLVPALAVLAAASEGVTVIRGVARLRLKESDRIASVRDMLLALGVKAEADDNKIVVTGGTLHGGRVDSQNDHRIAMAAAVAASVSDGEVTVTGAEAVGKSYPDFFDRLASLGALYK